MINQSPTRILILVTLSVAVLLPLKNRYMTTISSEVFPSLLVFESVPSKYSVEYITLLPSHILTSTSANGEPSRETLTFIQFFKYKDESESQIT